jgi:orotate phosphoribosyltransferase
VTEKSVRQLLESKGCILEGHFVGTSGAHLGGYNNLDPLLPDVEAVSQLCFELARLFTKEAIQIVAVPATAGIPLSQWLAHHLGNLTNQPVQAVWADKSGGQLDFKRHGFGGALKNKRVLLADDMINRMFSVGKLGSAVSTAGGQIVAVASIAANSGVTAESLGYPKFETLCRIEYETFEPENCRLCQEEVPIVVDVGHGDKFQNTHPDFAGGFTKALSQK